MQLLRLAPVRWLARLVPREVVGFCYHLASDRDLPHVAPIFGYKSAAQFEADLIFLKRNFRIVSYPELIAARLEGRPLGSNDVYLSFDDGYAECFSVVRPLLLKHGVPCTFFVTTDVLDNRRMLHFNKVALALGALDRADAATKEAVLRDLDRELGLELRGFPQFEAWIHGLGADSHPALDRLCQRLEVEVEEYLRVQRPYMTSDEVRQLAAEGFTIGGHTRMHPHLGSLGEPARVEVEIVESCRVAAELSGASEPVPFAFPFDADGVDREFLRELLDRHPGIGLLFGTRGMEPDVDFLINRMISDEPPRWGRAGTNLPTYFRDRYLDELLPSTRDVGEHLRKGERGGEQLPVSGI